MKKFSLIIAIVALFASVANAQPSENPAPQAEVNKVANVKEPKAKKRAAKPASKQATKPATQTDAQPAAQPVNSATIPAKN
jgi:hypothetical protein